MELLRKPYEISLWEDVLTFVVKNGEYINEYEDSLEGVIGQVVAQYYKERLICVIGSDTMDTPIRATQPKLVSKVNGENTLTFNMYSHYYDEQTEQYQKNPFIGYLINERKVKVRYGAFGEEDTKWYDLIIKNIQENSESKTFTYTAKDQFVNELSKSGFNLEFNQELENNMGNIETLAEKILSESDWQLKRTGVTLKQTLEEPLYLVTLNQKIKVKNMENEEESISIEAGEQIYVFYSTIANEEPFTQLLYVEENLYAEDDDHIITNSPNWYIIKTIEENGEKVDIAANIEYDSGVPEYVAFNSQNEPLMGISEQYRGKRLVRKPIVKYDTITDKYVNVYNKGTIYGYTEIEYTSPAMIQSYVTNPNNYDSMTGWEKGGSSQGIFPKLNLASVPDVREYLDVSEVMSGDADIITCLKFEVTDKEQILYNSGIVDMRHQINGFVKDSQYVFKVKYGEANEVGKYGPLNLKGSDIGLTLKISEYEIKDGQYILKDTYFEYTFNSSQSDTNGLKDMLSEAVACKKSLTYGEMIDMSKSLGLFIQLSSPGTIYIEDVQFFPYIQTSDGVLQPNEISNSEIKTKYVYYVHKDTDTSIDKVEFVYEGYSPSSDYQEDYNDIGYEKIRSITASESNRFNLIQDLCEIFECWPKFEVEHKQNGEILLGKDKTYYDNQGQEIDCPEEELYRQQKFVSFHEYIGADNDVGFKYGINLKSIQRTIDSDGIVSKLIVKNNSNEFARDGFCSIARASESDNGENFLLDFSYYIQQNLLGFSEITNDLYSDYNGYLGYYKKLKQFNMLRDQYVKEQSGLLTDIAEYTAAYQTYSISAQEASKQHKDKLDYIQALTGYTFAQLMNNQVENETNKQIYDWWSNDQVLGAIASLGRLNSIKKNHSELAKKAKANLDGAQSRFDWLDKKLTSREKVEEDDSLLVKKENLHLKFYKKYSRFLQEGSWISEDYIDDNLYYLDALSTLNTSAKPKITYNISVLELSQVEGYESYAFALGDKTNIEDTEFFGWTWKSGVQTPYQEEIVVTELSVFFDSPEQNQIKVQNYKTQFEDLFQRMAATTQSVEYSSGKYQKVAGIIETDGTINITTLQNSFMNNALTLQNAKDQSVVWDETGITTTSTTNPAEIVRIVSGGVFLSVDGGVTWNTGITGRGINASYITSGQMNVEEVNILNGSFPSFRWDKAGISAYEFSINNDTGMAQNFNYSKFVRLDQYGLYGINGYSNFNPFDKDPITNKEGEDRIWDTANFALTWRGFQIRSKKFGLDGYIRITEEEDIQLINKVLLNGSPTEIDQVKIGLLDKVGDEAIYGLRLKDCTNQVVLEQSSQGKVWIRDELKIGTSNTSTVSLGYLRRYRDDKTAIKDKNGKIIGGISQVIRAGDSNAKQEFIVYEDGRLEATGGYFKGEIHADYGTIGGVNIETILGEEYEVVIEITTNEKPTSSVFKKEDETKTLTAVLYKNREPILSDNIVYTWYLNGEILQDKKEKSIEVRASDFEDNAEYTCEIDYNLNDEVDNG